ncbi:MAG: DUF1822 family protein [Cyanobacteria bacterium SBLK]|nr:DUF1822 family protein [Cyanobacteria bacterium SBLK]
MNNPIESSPFIVSLTPRDHQQAKAFWEKHGSKTKAKQVYLNTLAVCAVRSYFTTLEMESELETGESWDETQQSLSDTADLLVKDCGKIECRPVLPDSTVCKIPFEVREDRWGYIPVQFDRELKEAKLLGFTATVESDREELPLSAFHPLDTLWDALYPEENPDREKGIVCLSRWLEDAIDTGWETVEAILNSQKTLATNFRSPSLLNQRDERNRENSITRGKLFDLERAEERIALFVGFDRPNREKECDIAIEVASIGQKSHLPEDLQLFLIDAKGRSVMQAEACSSQALEFHFSGELGERFSIKIALGEVSVTECFLI